MPACRSGHRTGRPPATRQCKKLALILPPPLSLHALAFRLRRTHGNSWLTDYANIYRKTNNYSGIIELGGHCCVIARARAFRFEGVIELGGDLTVKIIGSAATGIMRVKTVMQRDNARFAANTYRPSEQLHIDGGRHLGCDVHVRVATQHL